MTPWWSPTARKVLHVRDLTVRAVRAGRDAVGFKLGHNYRSFGTLTRVQIQGFPSWGVLWAGDSWVMSFYNVLIESCGREGAAGIGVGDGVTDLNAFTWYNLVLEACGSRDSGLGGGIDVGRPNVIRGWTFHGGTWEGSRGLAEARFVGGLGVSLFGLYTESTAEVSHGLLFDNTTFVVHGCYIASEPRHPGKGVLALNRSRGAVGGNVLDTDFGRGSVVAQGASRIVLDGPNLNLSVATGTGGTVVDPSDRQLQIVEGWRQESLPRRQTAAALHRGQAGVGSWLAPREGTIRSLAAKTTSSRIDGTLRVDVYRNGEATGASVTLDAAHPRFRVCRFDQGAYPYAAGDELDLRATTANWTVGGDLQATMEIAS